MINKIKSKEYLVYCLFLLAAAIFVLCLSTSTSPLYEGFGADSAIFQIIGKYWEKGRVPYLELFDHKGPYIFLIDAIGYAITGTKAGIMIVQIISLFTALLGIYKTAQLFFKESQSICWTFLTLGFLSLSYEGGNLTEEYVLPFLAFCTYAQLKYLFNKKEDWAHNYKWGFFYGITFSVCVMTRLTNAVGLCSGILIILCIMIREKEWKNIGKNILAVLGGAMLAGIPFIIYFQAKGALYEMFYGTILQNVKAAEGVTTFWWSEPHSIIGWFHIVIAHFCSYGLIAAGIFSFVKRKKEQTAYFLFVGITMTLYLVTRYAFYHYMMIATPFLPIIAAVCTDWRKYRDKARIVLMVFLGLVVIYQVFTVYRDVRNQGKSEPQYVRLLQVIPEAERNTFAAYNVKADIYLRYDIEPCCRYFHHQDAQAYVNEELSKSIIEEYGKGKAKWILVMETEYDNCIKGVLEKDYSCVAEDDNYALYCKK